MNWRDMKSAELGCFETDYHVKEFHVNERYYYVSNQYTSRFTWCDQDKWFI